MEDESGSQTEHLGGVGKEELISQMKQESGGQTKQEESSKSIFTI